jgi:hypothetical protein
MNTASGKSQNAGDNFSPKMIKTLEEAVRHVKDKGVSPRIVQLVSVDRELTMQAAQAIAQSMGRPLVRFQIPKVSSEVETHLNQIFTPVRGGGSILLFDEGDALFGKRTDVKDGHDRFANIERGILLQKMEKFDGVVIVGTSSDSITVPGVDKQSVIHLSK